MKFKYQLLMTKYIVYWVLVTYSSYMVPKYDPWGRVKYGQDSLAVSYHYDTCQRSFETMDSADRFFSSTKSILQHGPADDSYHSDMWVDSCWLRISVPYDDVIRDLRYADSVIRIKKTPYYSRGL